MDTNNYLRIIKYHHLSRVLCNRDAGGDRGNWRIIHRHESVVHQFSFGLFFKEKTKSQCDCRAAAWHCGGRMRVMAVIERRLDFNQRLAAAIV